MRAGLAVFAAPAARLTAAVAGGILAVALIAGAVRVLPLLLAPGVPPRLAPVLGRGVAAVAFEVALFVAPPIGWALATARLVERGEARALSALGVSPLGIVARGLPTAIAAVAAAAIAAGLWGREARAPGRAVRALVDEARAACVAAPPPAAAEVPLLGVSWICLRGEPPRAVGALPGGAAFAASAITIADDLSAVRAAGLTVALPAAHRSGAADVQLDAREASIRGLTPIGRASNLPAALRVVVLALTSAALAAAAALALLRVPTGRVAAAAIGAAGPIAALLVFSSLERAPTQAIAYVAVPIAGLAAVALATALAAVARARARA